MSRRGRPQADEQGTRLVLLEAAGRVFAEKGFDRATGKEISRRAGVNPALVNYHFGGMEGLYAQVLCEAHRRMVSLEELSTAVAGSSDAAEKLQAVIGLLVRAIVSPISSSWVFRVLGRELLAPSPAMNVLREEEILPKSRILKSIVSELTGLPDDHPAVARGCINVISPMLMLLLLDRRMLSRVFPSLALSPNDAGAVTRHLVDFALGGLDAIAGEAKPSRRTGITTPAR